MNWWRKISCLLFNVYLGLSINIKDWSTLLLVMDSFLILTIKKNISNFKQQIILHWYCIKQYCIFYSLLKSWKYENIYVICIPPSSLTLLYSPSVNIYWAFTIYERSYWTFGIQQYINLIRPWYHRIYVFSMYYKRNDKQKQLEKFTYYSDS